MAEEKYFVVFGKEGQDIGAFLNKSQRESFGIINDLNFENALHKLIGDVALVVTPKAVCGALLFAPSEREILVRYVRVRPEFGKAFFNRFGRRMSLELIANALKKHKLKKFSWDKLTWLS